MVEPQGIATRVSVPVSRSSTRRINGRMQTPWSWATSRAICAVTSPSGSASSTGSVMIPPPSWTASCCAASEEPWRLHLRHLVDSGHDDGDLHRCPEVDGEGADHVVGDVGDPNPGDVAVLGQDVPDAGGVAGDLVTRRPGRHRTLRQDHDDLLPFPEAEGEALVEQVPLRDGVLARVLQVAVDDEPRRPTQRQQARSAVSARLSRSRSVE